MTRIVPGTRALRTLEAAGRHLNFTRAAEEVGLTPAAVSYQIKEIEDQLGVTVFTRTSRTIRLTPAGEVLLEATRSALDTLSHATARARRLVRDAGDLRISSSPMFAAHWLFPRLPRWRAAHTALSLRFDVSDAVRDLDADDIDLAIRFGNGQYPGMHVEPLFETVLVPVCSPELTRGPSPVRTVQDLSRYALCQVDCTVEGLAWPGWRAWMDAAGAADFDDTRCVGLPDSSHVVQAIADGSGIGLVELAMVAGDLSRQRLVRLFDIAVRVSAPFAYHLVYPESLVGDTRVVAFRTWLLDEIGGDPNWAEICPHRAQV